MRHFLLRKLGPLSIALLALGMFARTTQTTLVASVGDALEFTSLCRPTRTAAIALPPIAVLAELHLTVAVRTVEEAIGFVDGCSASAFLDLDRTIDDSRLIAMSPPRWCDDCSASRVPAATGARSSYRWISRSSLMPSSPPKSRRSRLPQ